MKVGDLAFFYRSVENPALVGLVRVVREAWPDPDDPRFVRVDIEPVAKLPREVPLAEIRAEPRLADLALVRQPRLSVLPVTPDQWALLCRMAGLDDIPG
jgi:predicted RNA-binding protein with PUA-like domain